MRRSVRTTLDSLLEIISGYSSDLSETQQSRETARRVNFFVAWWPLARRSSRSSILKLTKDNIGY